jgi:hypothetical protein
VEAVDQTAELFADIVCSDPDWVDLEFEEIIAGLRSEPRRAAGQPQPPDGGRRRSDDGHRQRPTSETGSRRSWSTIRSPPLTAAGSPGAASTHGDSRVAHHGKEESHHVDVV